MKPFGIIQLIVFLVVSVVSCETSRPAVSDSDNGTDSDSDTDSDTGSDIDADGDSDTDSDSDIDLDSDSDGDSDGDSDLDSDSDSDSDTNTDTDTGCVDDDEDEWCAEFDCDDQNENINPGEDEIYNPPNNVDEDCDGLTDELPTDTDTDGQTIPETCEDAASAFTSVGCDFFAADLDNADSEDPKPYALVVSNPHESKDVTVTLTQGSDSNVIHTETLTPLQLSVILVACTAGNGSCLLTESQHIPGGQGLSVGSGFRLTSDAPVNVYQWNTYGAQNYTVDASLLLPTTTLAGDYIVATYEGDLNGGEGEGNWRSEVTVVATEDGTDVTFIPSVNVAEGNGIAAIPAGTASSPYTLNAYDVISIRAEGSTMDDLTGTKVHAEKPVVAFGAHAAAYTPDPSNYGYADHLEEQMLPLAAWGTSAALARHAVRHNCILRPNDPVIWRIIAGADDITVTFDPAAPSPAGTTYSFSEQGEMLEFFSTEDHFASAVYNDPEDPLHPEAPFLAYQIMTGSEYPFCNDYEGDPMILQAPPAGQFLDRYVFNTDDMFDYAYDHIIVVRPAGATINLDCAGDLTGFTPIGSGDWEALRFYIDNPENSTGCADGVHVIFGDEPFGISVVGTDNCQSYGYMGGVGVRFINPDPVI